jgi:D-alanyl-D-alanine carboxypeptidase
MLDGLGVLDEYGESFPLEIYKTKNDDYLKWLAQIYIDKDKPGVSYITAYRHAEPIYNLTLNGYRGARYKAILANMQRKLGIATAKASSAKETAIIKVNVDAKTQPPTLQADTAIVMDAKSGRFLYEKNVEAQTISPIVSKVMTCIMAIENGGLDKKVATMDNGKPTNNRLSIEGLLYGMMLDGFRNCADAVAVALGGSVSNFVSLMNKYAIEKGMKNTTLISPSGVERDKTTAKDLAILMKHAIQNPKFMEIFGADLHECEGDLRSYTFISTNELIHKKSDGTDRRYNLCTGGRTGMVDGKVSFASSAKKDDNIHVVIQLNIENPAGTPKAFTNGFEDAKKMHDWAFAAVDKPTQS